MNYLALARGQWDRTAAIVATAAGAVLLLVGYVQVSGTAFPAEQIPYLVSAGLASLFCLGVAGSLWIAADLRDEWCKLDEMSGKLDRLLTAEPASAGSAGLDGLTAAEAVDTPRKRSRR